MLNAVKFGHENFVPIVKTIEELAKECGKPAWEVEKKDLSAVKKKLEKEFKKELEKAFSIKDKKERSDLISTISEKAKKLYPQRKIFLFQKIFFICALVKFQIKIL